MFDATRLDAGRWGATGAKVLGLAAAVLVTASGCAGHGKYTSEQITAAKEKMAIMKSATEWEMARQAYLTGDFHKAIKGVDRSIAISPKVAKSHVLRGRILTETNDFEGALASFNEAIAIEPKNVEATYHLGFIHERMLEREKALELYLAASELEPQSAQYVIAAAEVMIDLGRIDEARAFVEGRHTAFTSTAGIKQTLGHIAMMQGRTDDAVAHFNQARLLAPDDLTLTEDLTRAQVSARRYGEAESNLARLLATDKHKDRSDLVLLRARCLIEIDRPLEARELLIKLTQSASGSSDVESWILLGNLSYTLKDANRTRLSAQRIIGLAPDRPEGYLLRGLQQRRVGQHDAAAESFRQASRHDRSGNALVLLGLTYRDQGQLARANAAFQEALTQDPQNKEAANLVGSVIATVPTDG
ncbi:MAG: tetratricopeptide repeat protein [Phycisphaeraceae bacterium]|nr:tetratricopeptide repeat protein [Phycisphaerae bacterium]MBX3391146.1 tetratricopeptide repeat protein [Phycisphaeraceae bacterium]